jgi:hypothetical protein
MRYTNIEVTLLVVNAGARVLKLRETYTECEVRPVRPSHTHLQVKLEERISWEADSRFARRGR